MCSKNQSYQFQNGVSRLLIIPFWYLINFGLRDGPEIGLNFTGAMLGALERYLWEIGFEFDGGDLQIAIVMFSVSCVSSLCSNHANFLDYLLL